LGQGVDKLLLGTDRLRQDFFSHHSVSLKLGEVLILASQLLDLRRS
jgi:hypothetical protein